MSVRDSQSKKVLFNTPDDLEQRIDRLTVMMGKLVTEDEGHPMPFKPQVYQSNRGRNQSRGNYHGRFRNNAYRGHPLYNQNFRGRNRGNFSNRGNYGYNMQGNQIYRNNYNDYRETIIGVKVMIEIRGGHQIDRTEVEGETEVQVTVYLGQDRE